MAGPPAKREKRREKREERIFLFPLSSFLFPLCPPAPLPLRTPAPLLPRTPAPPLPCSSTPPPPCSSASSSSPPRRSPYRPQKTCRKKFYARISSPKRDRPLTVNPSPLRNTLNSSYNNRNSGLITPTCPRKHRHSLPPATLSTNIPSATYCGRCFLFKVVGYWLLVIGCWLLVVGCWLLIVGCWLLPFGFAQGKIVGCWLLVVGCWLLVVGCWLLVVAGYGYGYGYNYW